MSDLSTEILVQIRDAIGGTNTRIEELSSRVERLERRQVEAEIRISTELVGVAGAVREVRDLLREDLALRRRVDDHEARIRALEDRKKGS
jgi:hypothetical protein